MVTMTEEQLGALIKRALKSFSKKATAGFLVLLIGVGVNSYFGQHYNTVARERDAKTTMRASQAIVRSGNLVAVDGCNREYRSTQGLRDIVSHGADAVKRQHSQGLLTSEQERKSLAFYQELNEKLVLPDCRDAAKILSIDPKKVQTPPARPLHPPGT